MSRGRFEFCFFKYARLLVWSISNLTMTFDFWKSRQNIAIIGIDLMVTTFLSDAAKSIQSTVVLGCKVVQFGCEVRPRGYFLWVYGAIDVVVEVVLSELVTYSWIGCDEATVATWVTRTGFDYLIIVV